MLSEVCLANKNESEQTNMRLFKNNTIIYLIALAFLIVEFTGSVVFAESNQQPDKNSQTQTSMVNFILKDESLSRLQKIKQDELQKIKQDESFTPLINFTHGDVSWLPKLASQAGWPKHTHKRLAQIILRESGGCPNRFGGSIVDKKCNIIGHDGSNHRSDSGLLQINGVNWDPKRDGRQLLCAEHKICTQAQLLDPLVNLKAGYILYQKAGWDPWDPCAWGPKFAHRCKP